ncbi:MAG: ATPase domain-containing protein [Halofilum sp. (in: g-proteobacteria)]|nr:ATPase domain-containing protein [Halofilum sp. (in: g-proteobacteria)]
MNESASPLNKRGTGVPGLDLATHGSLPVGSTVLVPGQSGAGKTILSLQMLANAGAHGEGGEMVSFEQLPPQIRRDAASFSCARSPSPSRCRARHAGGSSVR